MKALFEKNKYPTSNVLIGYNDVIAVKQLSLEVQARV
jgi:hypothetical protein